jgi:hypothetical protein
MGNQNEKKITSRQGFKHHKCEKFGYLNHNSYPLVTGFFGHCLHYSEYAVWICIWNSVSAVDSKGFVIIQMERI